MGFRAVRGYLRCSFYRLHHLFDDRPSVICQIIGGVENDNCVHLPCIDAIRHSICEMKWSGGNIERIEYSMYDQSAPSVIHNTRWLSLPPCIAPKLHMDPLSSYQAVTADAISTGSDSS